MTFSISRLLKEAPKVEHVFRWQAAILKTVLAWYFSSLLDSLKISVTVISSSKNSCSRMFFCRNSKQWPLSWFFFVIPLFYLDKNRRHAEIEGNRKKKHREIGLERKSDLSPWTQKHFFLWSGLETCTNPNTHTSFPLTCLFCPERITVGKCCKLAT